MPPLCSVPSCLGQRWARGFCTKHYQRWKVTGDPLKTPGGKFDPENIRLRRIAYYWAHVDKQGPDECWPWTAKLNAKGYGQLRSFTTTVQAHRFGFELVNDSIPAGMTIDHDCHTQDVTCPGGPTCAHRACQNPAHLKIVTFSENVKGGIKRRRLLSGHTPRQVSKRICSIDGCELFVNSHNLCIMHYQRLRRNGDPNTTKR